MGRRNGEKQIASTSAVNQHRIVDIRYRRLLRDVMAIPLEEARVDVAKMGRHEEDKTALLLANIFSSGG